jgi:hypothetical protein
MLRFLFAASVLTIIQAQGASASNYPCNPAVQNWQNGSQTTCPFDSRSGVPAAAAPITIVLPPVEIPRVVEEEDTPK